MVLLYVLVLLLLGGATLLVQRRARNLERRYTRSAAEADTLLRKTATKGGNSSRPDPYRAAKEHLELGLLVQKRDAIEAFFESVKGGFDSTWDINIGGTTYDHMVFETDVLADREADAELHTLTLPCRQVRS